MRIATEVTSENVGATRVKRLYTARLDGENSPVAWGHAVRGEGATAKAAEDDLARRLVWMTHCAPTVVHVPTTGDLWMILPWNASSWQARRIRPEGGFACSTTFGHGKSQRAAIEEFLAGYE